MMRRMPFNNIFHDIAVPIEFYGVSPTDFYHMKGELIWYKLLRPQKTYLSPKMKNLGEFTIRRETVVIHTYFILCAH